MGFIKGLLGMLSGGGIPDVGATEAAELLEVEAPPLVLDVRSEGEFAGGHIKGALNIPLQRMAVDALPAMDCDAPILAVCLSGHRSMAACRYLQGQGYTQAVNLRGGMGAWRRAGLPIVKD